MPTSLTLDPKLQWESLTPTVNYIKSPGQFLRKLVFGMHDAKATELIRLDIIRGGRQAAPFVNVNAEAIIVSGTTEEGQAFSPPNIRIKRIMNPSELLFGRRPNSPLFIPDQGAVISAVDAYIARELQYLADLVTNAEEVLCSQAITGAIAYSVQDAAVFTVTFPRDASLTIDLTAGNYWDDANIKITKQVHDLRAIMIELDGFQPTDVVLGSKAATAFLGNAEVQATLDKFSNQGIGRADLTQNFREDGAVLLSNDFAGLRWWEYPRKITVNGSATDMIRPQYAEFLSLVPSAEFTEYFGGISDLSALQGGILTSERFSKAWMTEDPSSVHNLLTSRPLPALRKPNACASFRATDA